MDDFLSKSPELYNYFYNEQTEFNDTLLYEAQQKDPVIRQFLFWKWYKNHPFIPLLTIRANKGLLHYYRRLQDLSINESNYLMYCIQETNPPKICQPISLFGSVSRYTFSRSLRSSWSWKNTRYNRRKQLFSKYSNKDCNTYTRLLELPNEKIHAKPPHGSTTAILRSFTILQSSHFIGHKMPNFRVFEWDFLSLCHRRRIHTLRCTSPFSKKMMPKLH